MSFTNDNLFPAVDLSYWNTAKPDGTRQFDPFGAHTLGVQAFGIRVGRGQVDNSVNPMGRDLHFLDNVKDVEDAGLPWWGYWRVGDMAFQSPREQAARTATALFLANPSPAPLMMDIEDTGGLEDRALASWLAEYREELAREGITSVSVYTGAWFWDSVARLQLRWSDLDVVVAHWLRDSEGARVQMTPNAWMWDELAQSHQPQGPNVPKAWPQWDGWQLAGDGSGVGQALGFASEHLDCVLLDPSVAMRWFGDHWGYVV